MSSPHQIIPEELEAALQDVRQVRSYVDRLRMNHPIRAAIQPMNRFALGLSPIFVLYGVGMQWLLDAPHSTVLGLPKHAWITSITLLFLLASSVAKYLIFTRSSAREGYGYWPLFRRMLLGDGYLRILGSVLTILGVLSAVVIQLGHAHMIVALVGLCSGAILIMIPLAIPLPEYTWSGIGLLLASSVAIFVLPAYPFYKAAVLFGTLCLVMGLTPFRASAQDAEEPETTTFSHGQEFHTERQLVSGREKQP